MPQESLVNRVPEPFYSTPVSGMEAKMGERLDFKKVNWYEILPKFGINKAYLSKKHGPCPLCKDSKKNRRFRFSNKEGLGEWFCSHCGGGNALTLIRAYTGETDAEILREIQNGTGLTPVKNNEISFAEVELSEEEVIKNRKYLLLALKMSVPRQPTCPVTKYLNKRVPGSDLNRLSKYVRFHKGMKFFEIDSNDKFVCKGLFPVMLAKVIDGNGKPITLHRTYLTNEGNKAPFDMIKKQMAGVRKLRGAAIRLIDDSQSRELAVCEGLETGWAIATAYSYRMSVWSLLNAGNLAVADIPRSRFDKVIIFADHDKMDVDKGWRPGEHFAKKLKEKLEKEGFQVEIRLPPVEGTDFADMWVQHYNNFKLAA
jgi:putative DNA primase/helicase